MLRSPRDFTALQASTTSKAHPLLILRYRRNDLEQTRYGLSTGRRLGGAVERNRVRRRLREALRTFGPRTRPGWDVLVVARPASGAASYADLAGALERLLRTSGIIEGTDTTR
jgi:ribonuclease P protein component